MNCSPSKIVQATSPEGQAIRARLRLLNVSLIVLIVSLLHKKDKIQSLKSNIPTSSLITLLQGGLNKPIQKGTNSPGDYI